jgi:hypothetical protein
LEINVALTPIKFGGREGCKWMNDRFQLSWQKIANLYGKTPPRSITSKRKKYHSKKLGGGLIRLEVWGHISKAGRIVTRYNLAYINLSINQTDSGRVLGYDNAHGFHHRHYMGKIEAVAFVSFELTSKLFASEWIQIANSLNAKGTST